MVRRLLAVLTVMAVVPAALVAQNKQVKDHPLVSRFAGAEVQEYDAKDFDAFTLPLGQVQDHEKFAKMQPLEGKVTRFRYTNPAGKSGLEIARSFQNSLQSAGFQILFKCDGNAECFSPKTPWGYDRMSSGLWCESCKEGTRFIAAKLSRPSGDAYVTVLVNIDQFEGGTWLSIVEPKPMATGTVNVNAAALANDISSSGHAMVNASVLFDTGKAVLKTGSDGVLAEMAKVLTTSPAMKVHVVGHTDNVGPLASNMTLSKQRADAVVAALVAKYKIAAARLQAQGVGPLAPIASNKTDDGRARNRRVELVEQ